MQWIGLADLSAQRCTVHSCYSLDPLSHAPRRTHRFNITPVPYQVAAQMHGSGSARWEVGG
jgi:hypothetical protein